MVVRDPCDMLKNSFKDSSFGMNKFPEKELINIVNSMIVKEPLNCSCGAIISSI